MSVSTSGLPRRPLSFQEVTRLGGARTISKGRVRNCCFTLNNPTEEEKTKLTAYIEVNLHEDIKYLVFQEELSATNTPHIQGYVEFKRQLSFNVAKDLLCTDRRVHIEKRMGTPHQASEYCKKVETRSVSGLHGEAGEISYSRKDKLDNVILALQNGENIMTISADYPKQYLLHKNKIIEAHIESLSHRDLTPNNNNVLIFVGPTGAGKTTTAWADYPDAYKGSWPTGNRWWWPNYKGQETVIFDEFRENISYQQILALFDIHPMSIEYKGGNTENVSKRIIVTTIRDPKSWYGRVQDKTELQRRIQQNATIFDFDPTRSFPNFKKTARTGVFAFEDYNSQWNFAIPPEIEQETQDILTYREKNKM